MDLLIGVKSYQKASNELYLKNLLYPEQEVGKIYGHLKISSATSSLSDNFSIIPNVNEKFLLIVDPFNAKGK